MWEPDASSNVPERGNAVLLAFDYTEGMGERRFYLREWRDYRGLTQQQLGDRVNMTKGRISELENRKRRYNEDMLAVLADALRCEIWELIGRNPLIEPEPVTHIWDRIPAQNREQARRTLESFTDDSKRSA
jgi:transcriptional regulator with XRE-family HTH domain